MLSEVFSEEDGIYITPDWDDLGALNYDITDGHCVGGFEITEEKELTGKEAADALIALGSDPGFFQLNDAGEDCEDGADVDSDEMNPIGGADGR